MKISTRTSYGLRLMLFLALSYSKGPVFLKAIAQKENISEKYLSQIIISLKKSGLVNSIRGAQGGYMLNKPPAQINVKDIIEVLEGNFNFIKDTSNNFSYNETASCLNRMVWKKLQENVSLTLEAITLKDLITVYKENEKNVLMYNI